MSVLKYWDSGTSSWQVAIVGAQGATGPTGTFGGTLTANLDGNGYNISNVSTLSTTSNVTVGVGGDFTQSLTVDGTIHAVFDNLYATGGEITADKNVFVGRLTVSDQPNDLPIPGITTANTAVDFSL